MVEKTKEKEGQKEDKKENLDPRVVVLPDETEIYIRDPDEFARQKSESEKAKAWTSALKLGCLSESQAIRLLKKQGIINEEDDAKLKMLQTEMIELLDILETGGDGKVTLEDARTKAIRVIEIKSEITELTSARIEYLSETIEAKARNAEFNSLVCHCAVYNDNRKNKQYFKDLSDYLNRKSSLEANLIAYKCSEVLHGLPDLDKTPEKEFLREYNFVDENMRYINEEGHLIDKDGRLVDEDGRYIKYTGTGENKKIVFVDKDGKPIKEVKKKPFLDKNGKPIKK